MMTAPSFTPVGLSFEPEPHLYALCGRTLISVTQALRAAGLEDRAYYTEDGRIRGALVHDWIERYHQDVRTNHDDDLTRAIATFQRAYLRFLSESAFRVDACEER